MCVIFFIFVFYNTLLFIAFVFRERENACATRVSEKQVQTWTSLCGFFSQFLPQYVTTKCSVFIILPCVCAERDNSVWKRLDGADEHAMYVLSLSEYARLQTKIRDRNLGASLSDCRNDTRNTVSICRAAFFFVVFQSSCADVRRSTHGRLI